MAYYADGSPYSYGRSDGSINVGWLDPAHPIPEGETSTEFASKLARLCREPVNVTRGWHRCELCDRQAPGPTTVSIAGEHLSVGHAEIRVPGRDGAVYAAPDMIVHYVLEHRYLPPAAFVEAVTATI